MHCLKGRLAARSRVELPDGGAVPEVCGGPGARALLGCVCISLLARAVGHKVSQNRAAET